MDPNEEAHGMAIEPGLSTAESRVLELQMSPSTANGPPPMMQQTAPAAQMTPINHHQDQPLPSTEQALQDHAIRQRRLGRACDACSKRKVKCGDVVPCKNCIQLGVQCTFARPAKRRGPANRVAEDLKRARFEVNDLNSAPGSSHMGMAGVSASMSNAAMAQMNAVVGGGVESMAPHPTVTRMVYDFFTYVYPLFPFPHEHLVMQRLDKREDLQNRSFCALIAALLATYTAIFPRMAQNSISEVDQATSEAFVGRCMMVCENARGPVTSERNVDDAATAFFLGIVSHVRNQKRLVKMFLAEAASIIDYLGVAEGGVLADGQPADHVTKELCRRIYWAISNVREGMAFLGPPSDSAPLPLATDDYYIYIDRIQAQPHGQLTVLDGFNLVSEIYRARQSLLRFSNHPDEREWESTQALVTSAVESAVEELKTILASGHPELLSLPDSSIFESPDPAPSQQARMHVRWELQKTMFRIAVISTRVFFAEVLATVKDRNQKILDELVDTSISETRELLGALTMASLEPIVKIVEGPLARFVDELSKAKPTGLPELVERTEELLGVGSVKELLLA